MLYASSFIWLIRSLQEILRPLAALLLAVLCIQVLLFPGNQSRTQSLQAFLSAVGRLESLWDNGIWLVVVLQTANQKIQRIFSINSIIPEFLPATIRWQKAGETLGLRLPGNSDYLLLSASVRYYRSALNFLRLWLVEIDHVVWYCSFVEETLQEKGVTWQLRSRRHLRGEPLAIKGSLWKISNSHILGFLNFSLG